MRGRRSAWRQRRLSCGSTHVRHVPSPLPCDEPRWRARSGCGAQMRVDWVHYERQRAKPTVRFRRSTPLLACATAALLGVVLIVGGPSPAVAFVVTAGAAAGLACAYVNGYKKKLQQLQAPPDQSLGAADRLADDAMQAALTSMLLGLGHLVHELRNKQSAVSASLALLQDMSGLDARAREVLSGAVEAEAAQERLLRDTIDRLKKRVEPVVTAFLPGDVVRRVAAESVPIETRTSGVDLPIEVSGDPEHLRWVLVNLLRNAAQAGAKRVRLELRREASGRAVCLTVHDDGPGVPPSRRGTLFRPFAETTTAGGTGLGLYLCRRYVELLGGRIVVEDGSLGGAAFVIHLPARIEGSSCARSSLPCQRVGSKCATRGRVASRPPGLL